MRIAILLTALGCAVVGGVFFAFSTFVMPALDRVPDATATATMNAINDRAETGLFITAFMVTLLACLALGVWAVMHWSDRRAPLVLAGAALYAVGNFVVTMAFNVPRNDKLADAGVAYWHTYVSEWNPFNHVRTITGVAAAAVLLLAALRDDA